MWLPSRVFVQAGDGANVKSATVGAIWEGGHLANALGGEVSYYTEASVGRWWVDGATVTGHSTHAQFGITPTLRLAYQGPLGFFLEGGIGANVITPKHSRGERRFSTAFNFGDHLGLGVRPAAWSGLELSVRVQHFSNAGIKHPNPGENFVQLRLSMAY